MVKLNGQRFKKFVGRKIAESSERRKAFNTQLQKSRVEEAKRLARAKANIETNRRIAAMRRRSASPTVRQAIVQQAGRIRRLKSRGRARTARIKKGGIDAVHRNFKGIKPSRKIKKIKRRISRGVESDSFDTDLGFGGF